MCVEISLPVRLSRRFLVTRILPFKSFELQPTVFSATIKHLQNIKKSLVSFGRIAYPPAEWKAAVLLRWRRLVDQKVGTTHSIRTKDVEFLEAFRFDHLHQGRGNRMKMQPNGAD